MARPARRAQDGRVHEGGSHGQGVRVQGRDEERLQGRRLVAVLRIAIVLRGSRNRSSGARFSFGGGSGRSWFSAPGSPGHTGGSGRRSIWDDAGPEPAREQGSGAPLDLAGLADGVEEAVDAYRAGDWGRFWRVVGLAALAIFVIVVMLSA
jgi:hypothetical protein